MRLRRSAPRYIHPSEERRAARLPALSLHALLLLALALLFLALSAAFLKDLASQIAVSDARDVVTAEVNRVVAQLMREGAYQSADFITVEKNAAGEVTAVQTNMAAVNGLSAEILERVIGAARSRTLTVAIPAGNLTGMSLLMGRGPKVPVQIIMLTSSRVQLQNRVVTAGINQTKHQLDLEVVVDIDVLIPWGTESSQTVTEVLIADTLVVGQVPETFLNVN